MPIIKSAIKKLRQDERRQKINARIRTKLKSAVDKIRNHDKSTAKDLSKAYSSLDRAAKKGVIHHKKASRLKSRLSKKNTAKT